MHSQQYRMITETDGKSKNNVRRQTYGGLEYL
jgi:hypothetical protein